MMQTVIRYASRVAINGKCAIFGYDKHERFIFGIGVKPRIVWRWLQYARPSADLKRIRAEYDLYRKQEAAPVTVQQER